MKRMDVEQSGDATALAARICRIALVTMGHPCDSPASFEVFESIKAIEWTHVKHPYA